MPPTRRVERSRINKFRVPFIALLIISVAAPLLFFAAWSGTLRSAFGYKDLDDSFGNLRGEQRRLKALKEIESHFPKEVIDAIEASIDDSGPLGLNIIRRKDLSSSWVVETSADRNKGSQDSSNKIGHHLSDKQAENVIDVTSTVNDSQLIDGVVHFDIPDGLRIGKASPAQVARHRVRIEKQEKRAAELMKIDRKTVAKMEEAAIERTRNVDTSIIGKYSIWRRESDENSDSLVRLMRDQLIMARVYAIIAQLRNNTRLLPELNLHIKANQRALGDANMDADLPRSAPEKIKSMGQMLSRAREEVHNCTIVVKKLRAMLQSAEDRVRTLKKQSTFLSQLAAKTIPKGINCLSLRLTIEYNALPEEERGFPAEEKLEDPNLFHYALFSDNVLAASVVVNSTVQNAKEPHKHVFHVVTDKLNYGAMKMWFLLNPPGNATINVENVDAFKWLNSSYCPVLRQLESAAMKEYYFKSAHSTSIAAGSSNLKYRNPKYLSMLNHLRFYLPQVYPKLDKVVFLDDDIVVQKDLSPLWSVDLGGKVNGAVETCGHSFHRFDKYLNFSNPHIRRNFSPNACGWAYGMNVFDLREWKKRDITGIYHKWQNLNEDRVLWKLGTLPPGLITFYNLTHPLEKSWHVLGLGYNPSVDRVEIERAAVIHYNGNMKPWLELAMSKYKPYWRKYVKFNHPLSQQCKIE